MQTREGMPNRLVMVTMLGLAACGTLAVMPARADDTMAGPDANAMKDAKITMWGDTIPEWMSEPAPVCYPWAAPATLNLEHYTDYSGWKKDGGSIESQREANMKARMAHDEEVLMPRHYAALYDPSTANRTAYFHRTDMSISGESYSPAPVVASSGDFIYVLSNGTLYQLRSSDLSTVAQKALPRDMPGMTTSGTMSPSMTNPQPSGSMSNSDNQSMKPDPDEKMPASDDNMSKDNMPKSDDKDKATSSTSTDSMSSSTTDSNGVTQYYRRTQDANSMNGSAGNMAGVGRFSQPSISVSGDYVYVLRAGTLYQFHVSDLSLATSRQLPWAMSGGNSMGAPMGSPAVPDKSSATRNLNRSSAMPNDPAPSSTNGTMTPSNGTSGGSATITPSTGSSGMNDLPPSGTK